MLKSILNITSAVKDLAAIGTKEVSYQVSKASNVTESCTKSLADKVNNLRKEYEQSLEQRKEGKKAEVVSEASANVISIN